MSTLPALSADPAAMTARARAVIQLNIAALQALESGLDDGIARACDIILSRPGYLVVTGMGKSGHIGGKIAATFASTGTPAHFVHPAEASHGDLGMVVADDGQGHIYGWASTQNVIIR
jgi:arabinose-5-phosphate isomerase